MALEKSEEITSDSLPERVVQGTPSLVDQEKLAQLPDDGLDLEKHMQRIEKKLIEAALVRSNGVRTRAADLLQMSYRSFRHYAKKYEI